MVRLNNKVNLRIRMSERKEEVCACVCARVFERENGVKGVVFCDPSVGETVNRRTHLD